MIHDETWDAPYNKPSRYERAKFLKVSIKTEKVS